MFPNIWNIKVDTNKWWINEHINETAHYVSTWLKAFHMLYMLHLTFQSKNKHISCMQLYMFDIRSFQNSCFYTLINISVSWLSKQHILGRGKILTKMNDQQCKKQRKQHHPPLHIHKSSKLTSVCLVGYFQIFRTDGRRQKSWDVRRVTQSAQIPLLEPNCFSVLILPISWRDVPLQQPVFV